MGRHRHLVVSTTAALLLAPTVLATPAWFGDLSKASPSSTVPKFDLLRVQSPRPDLPVYVKSTVHSTRVQNCSGVRCLWDYLSQKAKTAVERLGGDVEELADFIAYSHDDTLPIPKDDDDGEDWPDELNAQGTDTKDAQESKTPDGTNRLDGNNYSHASYPRQPPRLMTVALLAIAIGYFSLLGIHHLHSRTARLCLQDQVLPTTSDEHRRRHGDARSARRARRRLQQRAVTKCMRGVLRRWTHVDVAVADEFKRPVAGGNPKAVPEEEASTIEEDLARLRDVADFIDDVVAAEQGMARLEGSASTPCSQRGSTIPILDTNDDYLPTYDVAIGDQSLVSDGFQYAPGSSTGSFDYGEERDRWTCTKR